MLSYFPNLSTKSLLTAVALDLLLLLLLLLYLLGRVEIAEDSLNIRPRAISVDRSISCCFVIGSAVILIGLVLWQNTGGWDYRVRQKTSCLRSFTNFPTSVQCRRISETTQAARVYTHHRQIRNSAKLCLNIYRPTKLSNAVLNVTGWQEPAYVCTCIWHKTVDQYTSYDFYATDRRD